MSNKYVLYDQHEHKWLLFGAQTVTECDRIKRLLNASALGQRNRYRILFGPNHFLWHQLSPHYLERYGSLP